MSDIMVWPHYRKKNTQEIKAYSTEDVRYHGLIPLKKINNGVFRGGCWISWFDPTQEIKAYSEEDVKYGLTHLKK